MKKQNNEMNEIFNRLKVLYILFVSASKEKKNLYKNEEYQKWAELSDERLVLYLANEQIEKAITDNKVSQGKWNPDYADMICALSLCSKYLEVLNSKDIPELYQAHLSMLDSQVKEHIENRFRIDELNRLIEPHQETIDNIHKKANEYDIVLDYLSTQIKIAEFNIPHEALKNEQQFEYKKAEVERRLNHYNSWYIIADDIKHLVNEKHNCDGLITTNYGIKVQSSKISNQTEKAVEKRFKLESEILHKEAQQLNFEKGKQWVESVLDSIELSGKEADTIRLHYLTRKTRTRPLPEVASLLHYSLPSVKRYKESAVKKLISLL